MSSEALRNFNVALGMTGTLLELERRDYHNPPRESERDIVLGLRGGATVLMVAAFEMFLREVIEEYLSKLATVPPPIDFSKLPENMQVWSVFETLDLAIKGPRHVISPPKIQRISDIETACRIVMSRAINPTAFSNTGANPNSKTVREMWKRIGIKDIFQTIHPRFQSKWGKPIAATFIPDKLDEIVNRRHVVAHTAIVFNVTRSQLRESTKFLKIISELLDATTKTYVRDLTKAP